MSARLVERYLLAFSLQFIEVAIGPAESRSGLEFRARVKAAGLKVTIGLIKAT